MTQYASIEKQSIETPWGSPDVGLKGQRLKSTVLNILKEWTETMSKNLRESMRTISHQITNINKEVDLKKKRTN